MADTYTVQMVKYKGEKDNPHGGVLHKFYVSLVDEAGTVTNEVYWQRKNRELAAGEKVYGHIEDGEYGPRFKTDQRPDGSGNQGSSGGTFSASRYQKEGMTKDDYWTAKNERDVESQARMGRAHAQEMGLRWLAISVKEGEPLTLDEVRHATDWFHQDVQRFPLDADVGGARGRSDAESPTDVQSGSDSSVSAATADVSAERPNTWVKGIDGEREASPAQKGKLTQLFGKAGLSRDAMKAVVLFRCRSEKATKDGASKLIQDLMDGATHDTLLAEISDAARAGDACAARAAKLIPSDTPLAPEPVEVVPPNGEKDIPF